MVFKYQYLNQIERQNIIDNNLNNHLIEEQNINKGNFLIFSDILPIETITIVKSEYEDLQNQLLIATGVI